MKTFEESQKSKKTVASMIEKKDDNNKTQTKKAGKDKKVTGEKITRSCEKMVKAKSKQRTNYWIKTVSG